MTHRLLIVSVGAIWPVAVGIAASLFTPVEEPFRRQIALIWRAISPLVSAIAQRGDFAAPRTYTDLLYEREKDIRAAIDSSYTFYGKMVHQADKRNMRQYQLIMLRKVAGLVAANFTVIGEEMERIDVPQLDEALRVKAATLFSALKEAINRISVFVLTLKTDEKLLAVSHIYRLKKLIAQIQQSPLPADAGQQAAIARILLLTERIIKLMESALQRVDDMGRDVPVFRSYSFVKAMSILQPKLILNNIRVLFNFNTLAARYALRSAAAAAAGLFIYKWFHIDHGYWIPFSVMIIIQPYFGATFTKAVDRVVGTILGGVAGSLLLHIPTGTHIKEVVLFLTFVLMVYYMRKKYSFAVFVITLNLVLLFNIESSFNDMLMVTRAICTVGGALLAVTSGFLLLPAWDKKWLPRHLADAVYSNYEYFIATFYSEDRATNWTRFKRNAESKNSDVFSSFSRYMEEPGSDKSEEYYELISYNIRITRALNNIHLEEEEKKAVTESASEQQLQRISECHALFGKVIGSLPDNKGERIVRGISTETKACIRLNDAQMISLEKLSIELTSMRDDLALLRA